MTDVVVGSRPSMCERQHSMAAPQTPSITPLRPTHGFKCVTHAPSPLTIKCAQAEAVCLDESQAVRQAGRRERG